MKTAILKGVCLLAIAGCEAEAPAASRTARAQLSLVADRADAVLGGDAAAAAPVCRRDERVIYACDFGSRRVAVCATDKRLSYRFGDARRTDLEIDSRPGHIRAFAGGVVGGGGGHQNHLRFSNNGYQYIVHSMEAGSLTESPGLRASGVVVLHGEGDRAPVVRTLDCARNGPAQIIPGDDQLPEGAFAPDSEAYAAWW
ncbi:MAG: hypothetical protein EON86_07175 [Brevundimonas sp.]|nr:MAG: hypothetical protein EON86_07175 [Brevundimonas sp.]